ncbi:hypothetical protein JHK82_035084 [Glycine max]|uniref:Uncharacterized protein n=1 Tax=Glycine soja TaxID=3848 RepID=A0A445HB93_GLYSO|nr:hypothetical protein JHK87_035020 [Glycine soja]KAG4969389.1 hypothetical protein JHK85_035810 [Glycine max]KAG4975733.1 hypothetical protein JHK86_035207 [Glycine max]KAG5111815.1 hypothetical protein JHK82_035084 [Glycine max]KAG5129087.1 hypothetical protein JHK84_035484 [Glycine max]
MTDKTREAEKGCPPPMVDKVKSRIAVQEKFKEFLYRKKGIAFLFPGFLSWPGQFLFTWLILFEPLPRASSNLVELVYPITLLFS